MKNYKLTLSVNYVSHWSITDAIRELYQNALDHCYKTEDRVECQFIDDVLIIKTPNCLLERKTILLGASTKQKKQRINWSIW